MKIIMPVLPIILGFFLDCAVGDPYNMPHPIKLIGRLIGGLEKLVRSRMNDLRLGGILLGLTVILISTAVPLVILMICYNLNLVLGIAAETVLCCYMLAARCLYNESMKVCNAALSGDTEEARKAVSMIVGRDTAVLDRDGIIRAAVETVAENTSDGVTAPLFYMGIGGAVGAFFYKAVNTMDSMIGYKDEKYADIGRFAAKLDDVLNYIPSRSTALFMVIAAPLAGLDGRNAFRIWNRDRRNHASPNSAQTESVCAGALHLRLAGDAWYFGKLHKKQYIGDNDRPIEPADIRRANKLMYVTSALMLIFSAAVRCVIWGGVL
ncbi:adenosylcobinamide-phosphate synthase CbiB [Ruminococcus sp.]|uniref:adenosylcobinamide-phosphate synthase CbiB n=1 Tax=Ruminococcus sp. TaxID=41978 RepID=UPI0025E85A90|nr:adenosylcobinamide-phosphate synthase CbiB [Ruminococcus sp.]MCR4638112.1 adenosylcobinamide-phosphate synthase CbiB [Ruminococcus sp.]